jgi:hypothetical protein
LLASKFVPINFSQLYWAELRQLVQIKIYFGLTSRIVRAKTVVAWRNNSFSAFKGKLRLGQATAIHATTPQRF